MKWIIIFVIIIFSCACDKEHVSTVPPETPYIPFDSSFTDRTYVIDTPGTWVQHKKYPVIFALHGAGGTGSGMRSTARFFETDERDSCIFIYPDAKVENWEEGCRCNKPYRLGIDDVGFINSLLSDVIREYPVDTTRIYAVGFSQGGLFAQNLGCKLGYRFAAIASVASAMSVPLSEDCGQLTKHISVMMIYGEKDKVLPYNGTDEGSFSLLAAPATAEHWADKLSLKQTTKNQHINDYVLLDGYGSAKGDQVLLYTITNGDHAWSFTGMNTRETVLSFFLKHSR
ncbi:hypothetical protein K1X84_04855 [bacterium]|nr:hypothetical protein [bacterium]